jgi:hypothetical protein
VLTAADVADTKADAVAHPFFVIKEQQYHLFFAAI